MSLPVLEIKKDKITRYLLDLASIDGASKAKFFLARGFDADDWLLLVGALGQHGFDHWPGRIIATAFGDKHVLIGAMACPDGSSPNVLSVWMVSQDGHTASLVTARPALQ